MWTAGRTRRGRGGGLTGGGRSNDDRRRPNTNRSGGCRLKFPVAVEKQDVIGNAADLHKKLKNNMEPQPYRMIRNYRDIYKPSPAVLFATGSPQDQFTVESALRSCLTTMHPDITPVVKSFGVAARRSLVIRGVPLDVQEESIFEANSGCIVQDSIKRLPVYFEGKKTPGTTIMLIAATDQDRDRFISEGVKGPESLMFRNVSIKQRDVWVCFICTKLGHMAKNCPDDKAKGIDFKTSDPSSFYCYKCDTIGHRFRECTANVEPTCANCDKSAMPHQPHWPTDFNCPTRQALRTASNTEENSFSPTMAPHIPSRTPWMSNVDNKGLEKVKVRTSALERRMEAAEERDIVQSKALVSTRAVIRDVAKVATKKKPKLKEQSTRRLDAWYRMERMLLAEEKGNDTHKGIDT